jgi:hypothetical protein
LSQKDGTLITLTKGKVLQKYAMLTTNDNSVLKLSLDANTSIILAANSQLEIPAIAFDDGEASDLWLVSGQMRVQAKETQHYFSTQVTHLKISNADLIIIFDPTELKTKVFVFSGAIDFGGTESEELIRVGVHEKSVFQGMYEDGKASYDILLGGRKVAKGKLGIVEPISLADLIKLEGEVSLNKNAIVKMKQKLVRTQDQICEKPFGKLNECSWICDKWDVKNKSCLNHCIRRRCLANGEWADNFIDKAINKRCTQYPLPAELCNY